MSSKKSILLRKKPEELYKDVYKFSFKTLLCCEERAPTDPRWTIKIVNPDVITDKYHNQLYVNKLHPHADREDDYHEHDGFYSVCMGHFNINDAQTVGQLMARAYSFVTSWRNATCHIHNMITLDKRGKKITKCKKCELKLLVCEPEDEVVCQHCIDELDTLEIYLEKIDKHIYLNDYFDAGGSAKSLQYDASENRLIYTGNRKTFRDYEY